MRIAVRLEAHPAPGAGCATATLALIVAYLLSPESAMPAITRQVANVVAIFFGLTAAIAAMLLFATS
jgi:hypothetical protein